MGIAFTEKQQRVIDARGRNLLVSAAAGSGKTAVLVERIVKMVSDGRNPVDIDKLLVVTFTNAAAAEMRERISRALSDRLAATRRTNICRGRLRFCIMRALQRLTVSAYSCFAISFIPSAWIPDSALLRKEKED